MSVAVSSGRFLRGGGRLFFAPRAVPEKFKQFLPVKASATRGRVTSVQTKSPQWMTTGNQCFRVSEVAAIMTAVIRSMSSVMRKGK